MIRLLNAAGQWAEIVKAAGRWYTPCLFRIFTGLYCPGCGGTRALRALMRGELLKSALYHPIILYGLLAALWVTVRCLLWRRGKKGEKKRAFPEKIWKNALWIGIFLLAANWVVKNALLILGGMDVLALLDSRW